MKLKTRLKTIQKLKEPNRQPFIELNQALTNKPSSEVIDIIERVAVDSLELPIKKNDNKRER
jgi:hypothetical protein